VTVSTAKRVREQSTGGYTSHKWETNFKFVSQYPAICKLGVFFRTLLPNADMPYPFRVAENGWILVAHEQWMKPGSQSPSRIGFRLYYNESQLFAGVSFNIFVAPSSLSSLEGTPSVFDAWVVERSGLQTVDAAIGFHYNNKQGVDENGVSTLSSFGPTVLTPQWQPSSADAYNRAFTKAGVKGNLGQRDSASTVLGSLEPFSVQEGNIGTMPPTIWADWRVWLYVWSAREVKQRYTDGTGAITPLSPRTDKGSTAFGNPSFAVVKCPAQPQNCLFVSYFLFSEGAQPGEAGSCTFYNPI